MEVKAKDLDQLCFDEKTGLIPAIIQDWKSKRVLMLAYMNRESLELSLKTGETWFFSRSRQKLWHKGETSGNVQKIKAISYDCDKDTLLVEVIAEGPACHTGEDSCFYRQLAGEKSSLTVNEVISSLFTLIQDRKTNPVEGSYTNYLFKEGLDKILKKVGEETAEVIIGAKNQSKEEFIYEMADLVYHLLVLTAEMGCRPEDIAEELARRFKK
ncbi:bifunctional phosphoribosyl-AMP cyclohydrolase/phosphoribosyl-ATP pyrophosphatase [Anoxybacter fermentans]|uniref:Histidine biosynthesis bifunctional protein HisIE n=2 Tax=Anoxybacter fermentans TaxID=1323375 RepID=A0A3S9T2Z8_9FIRM|nr:bifunctional phosphoribosyl-AMP cyclohydrolase/phosphoribosyl-ATP pyrophosphatase [Anoxybacter fermentans]